MNQFIPEEHPSKKFLWKVEIIFDQFPRKFGSHESLEKASDAIEAIQLALGSRNPNEATMVRCRVVAPESYDMHAKGEIDGRNTTKTTRYKKLDGGVAQGSKELPGY